MASYTFNASDIETAMEMFKVLSLLGADLTVKLSSPLNRLNQAIRRMQTVDSAIELGVALEALVLPIRRHPANSLQAALTRWLVVRQRP